MIAGLAEDAGLDAFERDVVCQLARRHRIADQLVQQWIEEALRSDPWALPTPDR